MKRFFIFLVFIIVSVFLLMLTTLLLELEFVQKFIVRQLIVYFCILFEFIVLIRIFIIMYRT